MSEDAVTLRPYPFPFRAALSVCNDTDGMDWAAYEDWHSYVSGSRNTHYGQGLSLEVADSFWIWSDNGAFSLRHSPPWDTSGKESPEAGRIKELARAGWLDVLHSFGDWGSSYQLSRDDIHRGMDIFDSLGARIPAYVNHGGGWLRQHNLGGPWAAYQSGDDPDTPSYHLDHLLDRGFRFFWLDHLGEKNRFGNNLKVDKLPHSAFEGSHQRWGKITELTAREKAGQRREVFTNVESKRVAAISSFFSNSVLIPIVGRDDNVFLGFNRYRGMEGPTATNFGNQVSSENLDSLERTEGACIVYQHFGVWRALGRSKRHSSQQEGRVPVLDYNAIWAFRDLAERQADGRLFVTTTGRLLHYLWVRSNLQFEVTRQGENLIIDIVAINCPVYGASEPTLKDLQGIAFSVSASTGGVIVMLGGKRLHTKRAKDPQFDGADALYIPWDRLEFPVLDESPARTMSTERVGPPGPEIDTPIVHRSLTAEQALRMVELAEVMKEGNARMKNLRPDLAKIFREWHELQVPLPLESARSYVRKMHAEPFKAYVDRIARLTSGGGTALDAGSGTATWSFALSNFFDRTIAVDKTRNRVDAARWMVDLSGNDRIEVGYGDLTDLDVADNSVDFVFCYGVLIAGISTRAALREFRRVARPGAAIYVCSNGLGWSYHLRDERGKSSEKDALTGRRGIYNTLCTTQQGDFNARISKFAALVSAQDKVAHKVASAIGVPQDHILQVVAALGAAKEFSELKFPTNNGPSTVDELTSMVDKMLSAAGITGVPLSQTCREIEQECGEDFKAAYGNDILALISGRRAVFSHATGGLGRTPEEMKALCDELGLVDFRAGGEGELIGYTGVKNAAPAFFPRTFGGKQAVWEFMVRKPE